MKRRMGRPSIYSPKTGGKVYRIGSMTADGQRMFEKVRRTLKQLAKWKGTVSDADCVEFLVRGGVLPPR